MISAIIIGLINIGVNKLPIPLKVSLSINTFQSAKQRALRITVQNNTRNKVRYTVKYLYSTDNTKFYLLNNNVDNSNIVTYTSPCREIQPKFSYIIYYEYNTLFNLYNNKMCFFKHIKSNIAFVKVRITDCQTKQHYESKEVKIFM